VIDIHAHLLPGIDDGPATVEGALAMARSALAHGTRCMVATPHVNHRYPVTAPIIHHELDALRDVLHAAGIALEVLPGAEIALDRLIDLDDATLRCLRLANGPWLLVECPFTDVLVAFEPLVMSLGSRGYGVVLAHPERCPGFLRAPELLARLVDRGAIAQITADALAGGFGGAAQRTSMRWLREGLVHVIASDAHDHLHRPPDLDGARIALERAFPATGELWEWLTDAVPAAIVNGTSIPARPIVPGRQSRWRRVLGRQR
jgi:protein-tyrosine phosphatase